MKVALLAGGSGGAKLAAGMQDRIGSGLSVIANTGDDIETLGVHVSPDPDLVTYWLSGDIDEKRDAHLEHPPTRGDRQAHAQWSASGRLVRRIPAWVL